MPPRSTWALPRRLETENSAECPCPVPCASLRDGIALRRSCVASLPSPLRHFPCGPSRGLPPAAPARCRHDCSRSSAISAAPRTGPSPAPMRRSVPPIVPDRTPSARPSPLSLRAASQSTASRNKCPVRVRQVAAPAGHTRARPRRTPSSARPTAPCPLAPACESPLAGPCTAEWKKTLVARESAGQSVACTVRQNREQPRLPAPSSCLPALSCVRASQPLPSRHHQVHQFVWHHDPLHHSFAVHVGRYTRILQGPPGNLFFRKPRRHAHSPAHPPVDLHHNLDFFFARQLRIELRPVHTRQPFAVPEHLPQFLRKIRSHRRHHQRQPLQPFLHPLGPHVMSFRRVHLVRQFHDLRDGRVEMPARLKIICHSPQRLMRLAQQRLLFFGRRGNVEFPALHAAQPLAVTIHQTEHLVHKPPAPFDALLAPLQVFLRRRREQRVQPPRVRAILFRHVHRAHQVAARLGHRHSALLHHALREQPSRGLAVRNHSQVAHHLAPEPRIQQVQYGVRDTPDVLVNRKPVANLRRIVRRLVVVRVAVAAEIPRRIHQGGHRIRLATRAPP